MSQLIANVLIICIALCPQKSFSQIPTDCSDANSLENLECCPDDCGSDEGRGECANITLPSSFDQNSTDVRANWPHYFTRACSCTGNYAGYDCSRCKYGYYGDKCNQTQVCARKKIQELNDTEWDKYIKQLQCTRTHDSGYQIVLEERKPGNSSIKTTNASLYDLFVWMHHYAAKDNPNPDYAHEATGFPTWHRQYILWFEWEIQYMLKSMGESDCHTFRLHYWDWRRETQVKQEESGDIFVYDRLGVTRPNNDCQPQVYGKLFKDGWDTICWYNGSGSVMMPEGTICNPNEKTGPLLRCPFIEKNNDVCYRGNPNRPTRDNVAIEEHNNVCYRGNPNWPTRDNVKMALGKTQYDTASFDRNTDKNSFRNFLEGFESVSKDACDKKHLCTETLQRHLHNSVHIILGIGDFEVYKNLSQNMMGVMADVAASPNDPIFINHHAMVDCVLEEWLQRHRKNATYPDGVDTEGHRKNDYLVPFFPLFKHSDVFKTADNFGYSCRLDGSSHPSGGSVDNKLTLWLMLISIIVILMFS